MPKSRSASPLKQRFSLLSILLGLAFIGCSKVSAPESGKWIGKQFPGFVVDKWISSEPNRNGKFTLIDFWATWCAPCIVNIPDMNELHEMFKETVVIVGVSTEREEKVRPFSEQNIGYFSAIDPQARMQRKLGIRTIPYAILIDPQGIVRWEGHPGKPGTRLNRRVIDRILTEYQGLPLSGSTSHAGPTNTQSVKDFFTHIFCETSAVNEFLAQPENLNQFSKVEKDLPKFGLKKSDLIKALEPDNCAIPSSVYDAVREQCGARYTIEQVIKYIVVVKMSIDRNEDLYEDITAEKLLADHPETLKKYREFEIKQKSDFLEKAQKDDVAAQAKLGSILYFSEKNYQDAFEWSQKAAEAGSPDGAHILGLMYMNGQGTSRNDREAARWLQVAVDGGNQQAKISLSSLYLEGRGVPKDLKKSGELLGVKQSRPSSLNHREHRHRRSGIVSLINILGVLVLIIFLANLFLDIIPIEAKPYIFPIVLSTIIFILGSELSTRTQNPRFKLLFYLIPAPLVLIYAESKLKNIYKRKFGKNTSREWICRKCGSENATVLIECHLCKARRSD